MWILINSWYLLNVIIESSTIKQLVYATAQNVRLVCLDKRVKRTQSAIFVRWTFVLSR